MRNKLKMNLVEFFDMMDFFESIVEDMIDGESITFKKINETEVEIEAPATILCLYFNQN